MSEDLKIPLRKNSKVYKSVKLCNMSQENINSFIKINTLSTIYLHSIKGNILKAFSGMTIREAEQFINSGELLECLKSGVTIDENVLNPLKQSNTRYFTQALFEV